MGLLWKLEGLLLLVLRVALGGVFLYAAWVKLHDAAAAQAFAESIKGFKLLPPAGDHLVVLATFAVPWVEAIAGACLVLGLWSRGSAGVLLLNLMAFSAAIYSVLARGMSTKCGCFGKFSPLCPEEITNCNLIQNGALAAVALLLMVRGGGSLGLDGRPRRPRGAVPGAVGGVGAARASGGAASVGAPAPSSVAPAGSPSIKQAAASAPKPRPVQSGAGGVAGGAPASAPVAGRPGGPGGGAATRPASPSAGAPPRPGSGPSAGQAGGPRPNPGAPGAGPSRPTQGPSRPPQGR